MVLCSLLSIGLFAQNDSISAQVTKDKYTFGDFFDALDLPTVLGVGVTPNGIEGATFNSAMRLGWRHHKNYEVGMSVGYRFPLVRDIKAFYENPYFHPWDFFVSLQPGVSIATVKNATLMDDNSSYEMTNIDHVVPTLRFSAGVEWFIFSNFGVFAEAAYTQHLMPTIIEQAAINKGDIKHPSGPITISVGLSLFFN